MVSVNKVNYLVQDKWLSELFQYEVFQLVVPKPNEPDAHPWLTSLQPISKKKPIFIFSKLPVESIPTIHMLETYGFRLVDTNVAFEKRRVPKGMHSPETVHVRFAESKDHESLQQIAKTSFAFSRFHMDPGIPDRLANRIKAEWAAGFFRKTRGDAMVLSEVDGRIVGFLLLLFARDTLVIDLIAVDRDFRGGGLAGQMIRFAETRISGFKQIRAGTQISNRPSMKLYQKEGFHIANTQYILHFHNPRQLHQTQIPD